MKNKEKLLLDLTVGDIFHANGANGPHGIPAAICIVTTITPDTIEAIRVTTHEILIFHRESGISVHDEQYLPFEIDSIAELPLNSHQELLALYEKLKPGRELEDYQLVPKETQLLISLAKFYESNPMSNLTQL